MKWISVALVVLSFQMAHAGRWIVEDPASMPNFPSLNFKVVKTIELNNKTYYIIETPVVSEPNVAARVNIMSNLSMALNAKSIVEDAPIGLFEGETADEEDQEPKIEAWHVETLKYDKAEGVADGSGVVVAVMDTGVDYKHTALANQMWVNQAELNGQVGVDDDGNGFVDDLNGWDFADDDANPLDAEGHGTHCAGIIAGQRKPGSNVRGVAQGARIMAVRIIKSGPSFVSDAVDGIKYAVDNGAQVLSNSWRVYKSWSQFGTSDENLALLKDAIAYAESKGVVFVAAAGNESKQIDELTGNDDIYPVGFPGLSNLVGVGSTTELDGKSSFSNYGPLKVQIMAPGSNIYSTFLGNTWTSMSGTSMATPLIAGTIARGLSAGMGADVITKLYNSSADAKKWQADASYGRVDLMEYLNIH